MGERKGVNKYYPPDYDPRKGGLNKFQGTHALRERARKLHMGILIIRFEMPYNIWCDGCENHIGTGVRYNAEKKKVGMYYSTPIYQFRMKCHLCDNHFEIKTDPANLDYEIVSGARRQERRWDPTENEQVVPEDKEVTRKMAVDSMFKLEHGVGDKEKSKETQKNLEELEEFQTRRWHDDYASNQAMRNMMRVRRTKEKAQEIKDASHHLPVALLPSTEEDAKTAKLLQFTQSKTSEDLQKEKRKTIDAQSVFAKFKTKSISPQEKKAYARQSLNNIVGNSQKNFNNFKNKTSMKQQILGIVVKKTDKEESSICITDNDSEEKEKSYCMCNGNDVTGSSGDPVGEEGLLQSTFINCHSLVDNSVSDLKESEPSSSTNVSPEDNCSPSTCNQNNSKLQSLVGYDYSESESD